MTALFVFNPSAFIGAMAIAFVLAGAGELCSTEYDSGTIDALVVVRAIAAAVFGGVSMLTQAGGATSALFGIVAGGALAFALKHVFCAVRGWLDK